MLLRLPSKFEHVGVRGMEIALNVVVVDAVVRNAVEATVVITAKLFLNIKSYKCFL